MTTSFLPALEQTIGTTTNIPGTAGGALDFPITSEERQLVRHEIRRRLSAASRGGAFPVWWEPLYRAACNRSLFLSRSWMETWLETYGGHFEATWLQWTWRGMTVGGCLVLANASRIGIFRVRTLFLNTTGVTPDRSPLAEFNDILCVAGFEDAIIADAAALLSNLRWDRFAASGYTDGGIIARVVLRLSSSEPEIEKKAAPYIRFHDLAAGPFDGGLTANTRGQIRRCRRIYEQTYGPVLATRAGTLTEALAYFEEMAEMHNARWRQKGVLGSFSNPLALTFHRSLISRLWSSDAVDMVCVKAGERKLGFLYSFIEAGKVYFFQSGFAYEQNQKLKPGLLTHLLVIENYRERGMKEYDFLAGDAQYKRSLAKQHRLMNWSTVYRDKNGLATLLLLGKRGKALLRRLKEKIADDPDSP
jgi:Acetyltransferase (GNAT) domain